MNTKQIQYVLILAETLNFSQAAERIGISQPALSKQIQYTEKEFGVKLFDRNHSPLTLTPAGEYFVRNAKELLYKEDRMRKELSQFKTGENGKLVIGVTPFRSLYLMPDLVKKIRDKYPGVRVVLQEVPSNQLRKEAAEGKYDLAVVNLPVDTALLDVIPLESDTLVFAIHNSMVENLPKCGDGKYPTVNIEDVSHLPFVVLGGGQELRRLFDGLCSTSDVSPTIAAEVMGVTSAWTMAKAGVGVTLLPLQFVNNQKIDDDVSLYVVKNSTYSRQPVIVTRKGQFRTPYAEYAICLLTGE